MPDYNLGRAHGEISITADTRGAQEAQAAMAATAAEAEVLDKSMGRVNETFGKNRQQTVLSAEAIVKHRQQLEDLSRTMNRYHDDYQRAVNRTREAEDALNRVKDDEDIKAGARLRLANDVQKARDAEERALLRAEQSYARYQTRLQGVTQELANFNRAHIEASSGLNQMRLRADELGEALEKISSKMGSLLRIVGSGGIMGLFAGASSGTTAAIGAGGLSGLTSLMAGAMEMVQQLSGVIALLPAVASAAGLGLGTLAVGLHGVSAALSSMGDTNKFIDSLKQLSPAARQAMETIYSFSDAMRGARQMIQESLFAPIVADLQPLIRTWLPELMHAGQAVGNQFGQMGHQFAQFMLQPQTVQAFNSFLQNMVHGMEAVRGAINPVLEAWRTLSTVGSTFFPRIGAAITNIADEFNRWVETAAGNGKLQAWINSALTGFTNLGHTVLNAVEAIGNILSIGDRYGGGFLAFIRQVSEDFKAWTVSDRGRETLNNFFQLIQSAGAAVHPILKLLGEGIATVGGALTRLGIAIAPGVTSFFTSIAGALKELAPTIVQLGPSISSFLVAFGQALAQAVGAAGPELPTFFKAMSDALINLLPLLPEAVSLIAGLLSHLSPGEIQGILLAAGAIRLLAGAFTIFTAALDLNPIVLAISAIALLATGVVAAATNFQGFGDAVANALKPLDDLAGKAYDWGKNLLSNFINGISEMLRPLDDIAGRVANVITDLWKPGSPTRRGPLSAMSTEDMGARLTSGYAQGIAGGTGAVDTASTGVASAVAGTTGLGFSSAGLTGKSGKGVSSATGNSGFDQYISFITKDMQAWSNIFQQSFNLVQSGINTAIQGIKVVASIWGRGDNPLTRTGGILGPPALSPEQQLIPGVQNLQAPGKAPIPALAPLGGPPPGQQSVQGVPNVGPGGVGYVPGSAGTLGVAGPPAPGPGSAGVTAPTTPAPGDTPLVAALKANGSFSPGQIRLIQGFNQVEGPGSQGEPSLGFVDSEIGSTTLQGHVDRLAQQFKDRASVAGAFPEGGTDQEQAQWMAKVVGQSGKVDYHGDQQPADYVDRVVRAMQGVPPTTAGAARPPGGVPGGQQQPYGLPTGTNTHGYGNADVNSIFPPWVLALGAQFNVRPSTYPSHQESDRGGEPGYAPNPQNQNRGIDWVGSPEDMQKFAQALISYGGAEGPGGGLEQVIYQAGPGGAKYGLGGAGNVKPDYYPQSDPNGGGYDEHGGTGIGAHVHTRFSTSVPPTLSFGPQAIPQVPGLPRGPSTSVQGGLQIPGIGDDRYGPLGLNTLGNTAVAGGTAALLGIGGVTALRVRGANRQIAEAEGQLEVLRELDRLQAGGARPTAGTIAPAPINDALFTDPAGTPQEILARLRGAGGFGAPGATYQPPLPGLPGGDFGEILGRGGGAGATPIESAAGGISPGQLGLPGVPDTNPFENFDRLNKFTRNTMAVRYDMLDAGQKLQINNLMRNGGLIGNAGEINNILHGPGNPVGPLGTLPGEAGAPRGPSTGLPEATPLTPFLRGAQGVANAATLPFFIQGIQRQINEGVGIGPVRAPAVPEQYRGVVSTGAAGAFGGGAILGGSAATGLGLGTVGGLAAAGAAGLFVPATAFGAASGQEPSVDYTRPGGGPAPNFVATDAAGNPIAPRVTGTVGNAGLTPRGLRTSTDTSAVGGAGATPVHVTNPQDLPGGGNAPTPKSPFAGQQGQIGQAQAGQPTPPTQSRPVSLRDQTTPISPFAGRTGQVGGAPPANPPAQTQGSTNAPGDNSWLSHAPGGWDPSQPVPQDVRRQHGIPDNVPPIFYSSAPGTVTNVPTPPGYQGPLKETPGGTLAVPTPGNAQGQPGAQQKLPYNAQSPLDAFASGMASAGNVATDAFTIFNDVITDIQSAANITDTLARGVANTEDIVKTIQNIQTFIKTAADVAHLVSDVGGVIAGAGSGDPTGGAGAVGGGIQAIGAIIQSAIEGVNQAITIGIEVYHEIGKYAGYIFGEFLGGPNTGPLGGNVRMLLNTNTNQLSTYSQDNPLNKNLFNVPNWQRSYVGQPPPSITQSQVNIYTGPGQTPSGMMQESMWMIGTGSAPVASVAGRS